MSTEKADLLLNKIRKKISLYDFQKLNNLIESMAESSGTETKSFDHLINKYESLIDEGFCPSKVAYLMQEKIYELTEKIRKPQ